MIEKLFKRKYKKKDLKLESLYKDIKAKTIRVQCYHKNKENEDVPSEKKYCKMIKIDDLNKILEKHLGEKINKE